MSNQASAAAPQNAPVSDHVKGDSVKHPRAGHVVAGSGRQSDADRKAERDALSPAVLGPGSGTRVVDADGKEVSSLSGLHDNTGETIVTLNADVYEEFPAPGAPNRKIKRLLFHKGQQVPKSILSRHEAALKENADEVKRLAALGPGTGHPDGPKGKGPRKGTQARPEDPSGGKGTTETGDGEGTSETKEGASAGTTKEGRRGSVPRRS
jgi:hypothetical protein